MSTCPTCTVPLIVGTPVAGELGLAATAPVSTLVKASPLPLSSVKEIRTLMALPSSVSASVYVALVAPEISASLLASHW